MCVRAAYAERTWVTLLVYVDDQFRTNAGTQGTNQGVCLPSGLIRASHDHNISTEGS